MKINHIPYLILLSFPFLTGCSKSSDNAGEIPDPDPIAAPSASTLVFPEDNTECNEGTVINDTESKVAFKWNASQNTDSYSVNLTNLTTGAKSVTTSQTNEIDITILRGTPYEWSVTSQANGTTETASSTIWKFYNQGPGIESYAPFPADAISPARGATITSTNSVVALEWNGSDVDNDIVEYEVFFGTDPAAETPIGTTENTDFADISISLDSFYYWKIITTDSKGNTSTSDIFEFKVQ
ncbi:hypothetical protein [Maribacter sp. 2304DJ31-5]|uniref:hypothetical protein n=1 Tax=Maribacter sp. 2304DJ31-5 TaxID=3386273 RepID=UPI0039BD29FE